MMVHLTVESRYGRGSAPIEALVERAAAFGMTALALTDCGGMGGAIRFYSACRRRGIRPILGTRLPVDGHELTLLAKDLMGYQNLCRLITHHHAAALCWEQFDAYRSGLATILAKPLWQLLQLGKAAEALFLIRRLPHDALLGVHAGISGRVRHDLASLAHATGRRLVLTHPVQHLSREDAPQGGLNYLKSPREMLALGPQWKSAMSEAEALASECLVELPQRVGNGCVQARVGIWTPSGLIPHPELVAQGPLADYVPLVKLAEGGWMTQYDDPSLRRLGIALNGAQGRRQLSLPAFSPPAGLVLGRAG